MRQAHTEPSCPSFGVPWRVFLIAAFTFLIQACSGGLEQDGSTTPAAPAQTASPSLLLKVSAQPGFAFLSWSEDPVALYYRVEWAPSASLDWQARTVAGATFAAISVPDGERYIYRVSTMTAQGEIRRSAELSQTAGPRDNCSFPNFVPWIPNYHFFCSWPSMNAWLNKEGVDPMRLRCRNEAVSEWNENVPDCHFTFDAHEVLLLRNADSVFSRPPLMKPSVIRAAARHAIWGANDPFDSGELQPLIPSERRVGRVERYSSATSFHIEPTRIPGLASRITIFAPLAPRPGRVAIYHEGHGGAAIDIGAETIDWLLDRSWTVVAMDMPLIGVNEVDVRPGLERHNDFNKYDDARTSPLAAFLIPVKAVVDHVFATQPPGQRPLLMMIGRSGGGWTTYVYSALDPRIALAVPVAGGRPLSQRLDAPWGPLELGDYEQVSPHLYTKVGHAQLLTTAGSQGALLMYNELDPCCFRLTPNDPFVAYVKDAAATNGTDTSVFIDRENPQHSIGPAGFQALESFLSRTAQ